jgi:hypothetical protein
MQYTKTEICVLQKGCVSKSLLILLKKLMNSDIFKDYFLVGGTSLAMQIGHRHSDDIDLFTQKEIDKEEIGNYLFNQQHPPKGTRYDAL